MICTNYQQTRNSSFIGKFPCPQPGMSADKAYCCGELNYQYCCTHLETSGAKWGLAIGIILGVLILAVLAYTIHAIRALDRCYHECPACGVDETFKYDCRWYTVSNEGNRYGVTFHSRKFAKCFMAQLAARYGQWNQADILRIKRGGKDFVVLNIYYNDLFTPWFYTQGPMRNDTQWINSDFVELIALVKEEIRVPLCCNRKAKKDAKVDPGQAPTPIKLSEFPIRIRIDEPAQRDDRRADANKSGKAKRVHKRQGDTNVDSRRKVDDYLQGTRDYLLMRSAQWLSDSEGEINVPSVIIEDVEPSSSHSGTVKTSRSVHSALSVHSARHAQLDAANASETPAKNDASLFKSPVAECAKPDGSNVQKLLAKNATLHCTGRTKGQKAKNDSQANTTVIEVHAAANSHLVS